MKIRRSAHLKSMQNAVHGREREFWYFVIAFVFVVFHLFLGFHFTFCYCTSAKYCVTWYSLFMNFHGGKLMSFYSILLDTQLIFLVFIFSWRKLKWSFCSFAHSVSITQCSIANLKSKSWESVVSGFSFASNFFGFLSFYFVMDVWSVPLSFNIVH